MNIGLRKVVKTTLLYLFRVVGVFFLFVAILQLQDHYVGYAFVSIGIGLIILYFSFRKSIWERKRI